MQTRPLIPHFINAQFRAGSLSGVFEAVSIFVDLTGFTTLTENLMRHGNEGVEELSAAINAVFSPLVHSVYAQGGFISTFAGDAFTVLFPMTGGEDVPLRAVQAALTIRDFMHDHADLETPYGTFKLGVRTGVGLGTAEWSILGRGENHTYLFRGSAVDTCLTAQHDTPSGEVGLSSELRSLLGDRAEIETQGEMALLKQVKVHLPEQAVALPELEFSDLHPFVLDAVINFLAQAEFRNVATIFIALEWAELQAAQLFVNEVLDQVIVYGGYFNKLDYSDKGTVIMVVFGAPTAYGNDLIRAANFLLALKQSHPVVHWRAGLTYGTVYAGFIGGVERSEYTVIGDAVNLCARQASQAAWGECWLNQTAAETLRHAGYGTDSLGAVAFKGKEKAVDVFRLIGTPQKRIETRQVSLQLLGRDSDLTALRDWLRPLLSKRFCGVMTVYGEAGIGKSHLVFKFMNSASRYNWFYCSTDEIFRQSLNPFRSFLKRYFDQSDARTPADNRSRFDTIMNNLMGSLSSVQGLELGTEVERVRPFLAALVDLRSEGSLYEQLDPKLRFDNMLLAIKALVLAESLRQPVIIHIEDAQWLDDGSRQLLKILTRNVSQYPVAILMTSRYQDDNRLYALDLDADVPQRVIELKPLSSDDVRTLAEQILETPLDERLADVMIAKSAGNPFFVEQLALDLRERGALSPDSNGLLTLTYQETPFIPSTISAVLMARLDRLMNEIRTIVYTATVLGQEFEVNVLSSMLYDDPDLTIKIERAESEAIWDKLNELRYTFRHALLRDTAYDMQLRSHLRDLHLLAREAIEKIYADDLETHYVDLFYHAGKAGDTAHEKYYARLVGAQAAERFANAEAVRAYTRALELTPENQAVERFELLLAREKVYELMGAREEQLKDLDQLQALAGTIGEPDRRAEALLRRAVYAEVTSDFAGVVQHAEQTTRLAVSPRLKASGYLYWGLGLIRQAQYADGKSQLEKALEIAHETHLISIEADAAKAQGTAEYYQGNYAMAQTHFEQALKHYEVIGDRRGMNSIINNLGGMAYVAGDYRQALAYLQQAAKGFLEIGDRYGESVINNNIGGLLGMQRRFVAAFGYIERALFVAHEIGNRRFALNSLNNIIIFAVMLGDFQRAYDSALQALDAVQEINDPAKHAFILNARSLAYCYEGKWELAYRDALEGLKIAQEIKAQSIEALLLTMKGRVEEAMGKAEEAETSYGRALEIRLELGENHDAVENRACVARLALMTGKQDEALHQVEAILNHLKTSTLDGASEPVRIYLSCYQVLAALQDARAAETLQAGYAFLQDTASKIPDDQQRQKFLKNIPHHRDLMALWNETNSGKSPV